MYKVETETYKGYDIDIYVDEYADSPREWDNLTKLALFHNNYDFPNDLEISADDFDNWEDMEAYIEREYDPAIMRRVSMYEHSGIALNLGSPTCPWDSGYIGFILVTKEDIREAYNIKRVTQKYIDLAYDRLKGEFEDFSNYASGSVYGYNIEKDIDQSCADLPLSCWGFYGYDFESNGLLQEARCDIDCYIKEKRETRFNKIKDLIRNSVPLHLRQTQLTQ